MDELQKSIVCIGGELDGKRIKVAADRYVFCVPVALPDGKCEQQMYNLERFTATGGPEIVLAIEGTLSPNDAIRRLIDRYAQH